MKTTHSFILSQSIKLVVLASMMISTVLLAKSITINKEQQLRNLRHPVSNEQILSQVHIDKLIESPCFDSLFYLVSEYVTDSATFNALNSINLGFQDLPPAYAQSNPWKGHDNSAELVTQMLDVFVKWCTFRPQISGDQDDGLKYIQKFAWFYYKNSAAQAFVQGRDPNANKPLLTGLKFTQDFSKQRGLYMDTKASAKYVPQWVEDPRIEIDNYIPPNGKDYIYTSWNQFFARQIKIDVKKEIIPSRPVTMPEKDYVVSSPTDCIMNPLVQVLSNKGVERRHFISNPLQTDTVLDVKNIPINLMDLLGDTPDDLKQQFIGGTGLSCVLMPNTYHHFHTPVSGIIEHAEIVKSGTYGYLDFPNWVPVDGNVGRPGTDFSQFEVFQRAVVIIKVTYKDVDDKPRTGYVASIPVGLDTIGSVVLDPDVKKGTKVKRGYSRLGNFFYGGSLNILLFSQGLATGAIQTRLGNQITLFDIGKAPE
jgi:phosphatidylserine decarboxylase